MEDSLSVLLGYLTLMRLCCIWWKLTNTTEFEWCLPCLIFVTVFHSTVTLYHPPYHSLFIFCGLGDSFIKCLKLCQKVQERQVELSQLGRYGKPGARRSRIERNKENHYVISPHCSGMPLWSWFFSTHSKTGSIPLLDTVIVKRPSATLYSQTESV